ncbi:hypothetical protein L3X14_17025 [Pseudomonas balearica]|uniref:hypothetical protein n=1 Tax=Stutzerimonas balearica TaxID=74829 RepID=UPI001F1E6BBA|nr:hypothetical protein [Stutzerimonas balearica]MCF6758283.1 hypothetical protein [Stutzerimonas balearica]
MVIGFTLINPGPQATPAELRAALDDANRQLIGMAQRLDSLTHVSSLLTERCLVIVEAHLAGDSQLVTQCVDKLAQDYLRNRQAPVARVEVAHG